MYIRPFTISGVAIVLLQLYLAAILFQLPLSKQTTGRSVNHQLAFVLAGYAFLSLHQHLLSISDLPWFSWTQYLRNFEAMLVIAGGIRFCYMLVAIESDSFSGEYHKIKRIGILLFLIEAIYVGGRLFYGYRSGTVPSRPLMLQFPLVMVQTWLLACAIRFMLYSENPDTSKQRLPARIWQTILTPHNGLARFLRSIIVSAVVSFGILILFVMIPLDKVSPWIANQSDSISIVITISVVFSYLRYQLDSVGLQVRISVIGLALFLIGSSTLGWLIATVVLGQAVPGVPIQTIIGSVSQTNFQLDMQYEPALQHLHEILLPMLWFVIGGSIAFVVGYRAYYRLFIAPPFNHLMAGIERLERGELAFQIEDKNEDEFGRIANALNRMANSLRSAEYELAHYQANLEQTLEARTEQLRGEIEQRKDGELHIALRDERNRIARDAHDGILQNMLALRARLRSRRVRRLPAPELERELDELAQEALESAHELRHLIHSTSIDWAEIPFREALGLITTKFQKAYPIEVNVNIPSDLPRLRTIQHISILRVIQESLANIGRHSNATQCEIKLNVFDDSPAILWLQISDNGIGIDGEKAAASEGFGLSNMRGRAMALGGSIDISPILDEETGTVSGTLVKMLTPLN